ncbi:MAG: DUF3783 domain-containing protein [Lachnospiraceae bacterium]
MENEKILLFSVNVIKTQQIAKVCDKLGISLQSVPEGDKQYTLGYLAGIPGIARYPKKKVMPSPSNPEMMVFSGLTNQRLDLFLQEMKTASVATIRLKAVMTPFNIIWSAHQLQIDLMEHAREDC